MRLAKSVEIMLGLAASGSLALVLSGSAYAAESDTGTTSQTIVRSESHQAVQGTGRTVNLATPKTLVITSQTTSEPTPANLGGAASNEVVASGNSADSVAKSVSASTGSDSKSVGPSAETKPLVISKPAPIGPDSIPAGSDNGKLAAPQVTPSISATWDDPHMLAENVVFNSAILTIQPRITNSHPVQVADLAASVPSSLEQRNNSSGAPAPSQPSGALGQLTAVLAGSVVPAVFMAPTLGFMGLTAEVAILIAVACFIVRRALYAYSDLIRRGGFVHAARSDVAQAPTTFFATPLNLSYGSALPPFRSSFLMVSDMKTVLSMVPTLIERRI